MLQSTEVTRKDNFEFLRELKMKKEESTNTESLKLKTEKLKRENYTNTWVLSFLVFSQRDFAKKANVGIKKYKNGNLYERWQIAIDFWVR